MRVPLSWLREFVDLDEDITLDQVHADLVKVGFEEEGVYGFDISGPVVVGQVLGFTPEPQTNGKTINWCQVDVGESAPRGIVCGAHNFEVGDRVVVSLPGAVLPGPFPIAARTTYGHVSDGMIASARELGLGDEHEGILRLAALGLDPEPGVDAIGLLGLDDAAVDINVTPDRGYALSIRGVAREYNNSTGATFRDPAVAVPVPDAVSDTFPVVIDDQAPVRGRRGVNAYVTRVVRGIDPTRPTPPWMVARLVLAGIRSISLVVDITNYVMIELGQPIHGFDLERVRGAITVRRAAPGEMLETLDGQTRKLHGEDLVITDESGPIALAGVMGGAATEVGDATTSLLIESANFDPLSVARTARRHKLPSEASRRFERGVDPKIAAAGAARVVQLLEQLARGTADPLGSMFEDYEHPAAITLPDGFVPALIGVEYTNEEIESALTAIGCTVERTDAGLAVTPPTWRPDLTDAPTLAEEVARINGYDRIPSILPTAPPGRGLTRGQRLRRSVAQQLAAGGSTEVLSYPFVAADMNDRFGDAETGAATAVRLANPLDGTVPWLRTSLLPGLIEIARRNLSRGLVDVDVYEIGTVFRPEPGVSYDSGPLPAGDALPTPEALATLESSIPPQPLHVGGLVLGSAVPRQPGSARVAASVTDALTAVHQVAAAVAVAIDVEQGTHQSLHPGRTASLSVGGVHVGWAGELLPSLALELDLPRVVAAWELDLDALIRLAPEAVHPAPIATLPAATQDLSLVVPVGVPAGDVLAAVRAGAGPLLENLSLVDDYRGGGLPDGAKSLTFALRFRAPDRTLTAQEASDAKLAGAAVAAERFGATVRE